MHQPKMGCSVAGCDCRRSGQFTLESNGFEGKFTAGNSGGGGRLRRGRKVQPKELFQKLLDEYAEEWFAKVVELAFSPDKKIAAFWNRFLAEQLGGKAVEQIKLTGADGGPVQSYDLTRLPVEDLRRVRAALAAAAVEKDHPVEEGAASDEPGDPAAVSRVVRPFDADRGGPPEDETAKGSPEDRTASDAREEDALRDRDPGSERDV